MLAGSFGVLAIFARSLGGYLGDRAGRRFGLDGRGRFLTAMLLAEGLGLIVFSRMGAVVPAAIALVAFGLFVHIAAGATYSVVPFIKPNGVGAVAGIVGAGGNAGAVLAGLLFRGNAATTQTGLLWLGGAVVVSAALAAMVRFGRAEAADQLPVTSAAEALPAE